MTFGSRLHAFTTPSLEDPGGVGCRTMGQGGKWCSTTNHAPILLGAVVPDVFGIGYLRGFGVKCVVAGFLRNVLEHPSGQGSQFLVCMAGLNATQRSVAP
jgi:hypothetical protein